MSCGTTAVVRSDGQTDLRQSPESFGTLSKLGQVKLDNPETVSKRHVPF